QTIFVTEGVGVAQRRGGPVEVIRTGDRVFFEPGEDHWHGAAPTRFMTHIAMLDVDEKGNSATWGDHVSDTEYAVPPIEEASSSRRSSIATARARTAGRGSPRSASMAADSATTASMAARARRCGCRWPAAPSSGCRAPAIRTKPCARCWRYLT